jgi:hypothetical protein
MVEWDSVERETVRGGREEKKRGEERREDKLEIFIR